MRTVRDIYNIRVTIIGMCIKNTCPCFDTGYEPVALPLSQHAFLENIGEDNIGDMKNTCPLFDRGTYGL
jgi:hypothetical protein